MQRIRSLIDRLQIKKWISTLYQIKVLRLIPPIVIIGLVYWEGQKEFRTIHWGKTLYYLRHIHPETLLFLFCFSLIAVSIMTLYDLLIRRHFQLPLSRWQTFRYGWIANTSSNLLGFAGLTGAGIRTALLRSRGTSYSTIAAAVGFLSTIPFTGLSLLAWFNIFAVFPARQITEVHHWLIYAVWGSALYLPLFVLLQRTTLFSKWFNRDRGQMQWRTISSVITVSFMEWLFAGLTFWFICRAFFPNLSFSAIFGIYILAAIAGMISMAPSGIGGFDLTALLGLQLLGHSPEKSAVVLILFRLLYYILPWLIGLIMAAFEFSRDRKKGTSPVSNESSQMSPAKKSLDESGEAANVTNTWLKLRSWPGPLGFIGEVSAWSLSKLVFIAGALLILSAATPALLYRFHYIENILSLPIMRLSHQLSIVIGIMLIVLSRGISLRVKRAYSWTLLLLCTGAIFTFAKAFDYEEAIILLLIALLLWMSRQQFYRLSVPLRKYHIIGWMIMTACITGVYYFIGASTRPFLKKPFHFHVGEHAPKLLGSSAFILSAVSGLLLAWLLLTLYYLLRPKQLNMPSISNTDRAKLSDFLERYPGNMLTHMLFAGDKSFFWAIDNQVLIPYAKIHNKLVVLGDPLGPREMVSEAIQQFQNYADQYALETVFYQTTPDYLPLYHENGYRFFKLGEEALVDLSSFTLSGKRNAALRAVHNRFEREGFRFEIASPPHQEKLMERLKYISDQWLRGKKEKGFSIGWFDENYLQLAPLALITDQENKVIAFASIAPVYDHDVTLSVDLMRHLPEVPNGTMDQLFISLFEFAREQGYSCFNLGMAPLASVGKSRAAMREEKLAHILFEHGESLYGFTGLRNYKEKFSPRWEPRYLAYPTNISLPVLLLELVSLVSRKPHKLRN
ncbi:bifunctional lysylphosphatidylglycerol flippase/synthetase MprF [Paenibacillus motobuensis]|uniref:Phosphatidylglycerol lysyltransferase n=1 Tax=Paenibacillus motobuensis TaxID=295324 RepID=A0ABP3IE37_9BACL